MPRKKYKGKARLKLLHRIEALKDEGLSHRAIAAVLDETDGTIAGTWRDRDKIRKYASVPDADSDQDASGGSELSHDSAANASEGFLERTFTGLGTETVVLPRFDGEPHVYADCVVSGDFQLPTADFEFADVLLKVAQHAGIKTLLIVGDWVNMDAFSKYEHIVPPVPFEVEMRASVSLMARYAGWFDVIWLALGNHEQRLMKLLRGDWSNSILARLLSASCGKLRITPYSHIVVHSGGQVWRCTHQRNYSKLKGRVGDELAQKYQCNIVSHHQHHAGKIMDRWGRYVVIDNGGIHDAAKMAYVGLVDSTSPTMTKGFTVIMNGTGHLITPYDAFTDLSLWLDDAADWAVAA